MTRNEEQFIADCELHIFVEAQGAVLVGHLHIVDALPVVAPGHTLVGTECLQTGVHDGVPRPVGTHHRRQHEQAVLKVAHHLARTVEVARIVRIHEHVRSRLHLVVHSEALLEFEGAGPGAANDLALQIVASQQVDALSNQICRFFDRHLALGKAAHVLRAAVIGL